jgi:hypothetical protein
VAYATGPRQSSLSRVRVPWDHSLTVTALLLWGALSDDRTGLIWYMLLALARVVFLGFESLGTRDHILLPHVRLPFSSPPTTRMVTMEVFDPVSTRVTAGD